ncbi:5-oxoprolinase subunit B family protein [Pseudoclavibacter sp. CFCC 11306]|uniref:5-oxoprolinase subunit B family protein n=1 Tax=Pseudoclavibacter sp. CFCC 11306 TaxID=1564493 RepID=UPI0013016497|nr:carboxyltransferase domain-containing protein [Pseudoclavibacter sp. CFCC 11306]KAB1658860.1 carboxyltransferase domain-containing protein [Pseudoclavibacter sp. CFCC 11306]
MRVYEAGEEFLLVELSPDMRLKSSLVAIAVAKALTAADVPGMIEAYPTNASLLIRFDPEILGHDEVTRLVQEHVEAEQARSSFRLQTRVIEVPVWFDDPETHEVAMRFRSGHQDPSGDDLDFAARVNGLDGRKEFIERYYGAPWFVSVVGFVAGLPELFQITDRRNQLQVPKYLRPRTDTPPLSLGHGGAFGAIYSVRGGGGYQLIGMCAAPIFDPQQQYEDFADSPVLFRAGDIVRYRPVDEDEFGDLRRSVSAGAFRYRTSPFEFDLNRFTDDTSGYAREINEVIAHD